MKNRNIHIFHNFVKIILREFNWTLLSYNQINILFDWFIYVDNYDNCSHYANSLNGLAFFFF